MNNLKEKYIQLSIEEIELGYSLIQEIPIQFVQSKIRRHFGEYDSKNLSPLHLYEVFAYEDLNIKCLLQLLEKDEQYEKCELLINYLELFRIVVEEWCSTIFDFNAKSELEEISETNKNKVNE